MSTGMPELGSKISLISKADIRYEGRLFTVDPQECTIALASVRSFGTEDRETQFPVAPQSQVYDYILFRGSDIKDIRVLNNVPSLPNDPAIMQMSVPPTLGGGAPPPGQFGGQFSHPVVGQNQYPQYHPMAGFPGSVHGQLSKTSSMLDLIGGGSQQNSSRSGTPGLGHRKSPTADQGTQAGAGAGAGGSQQRDSRDRRGPHQAPGKPQQQNRTNSRNRQRFPSGGSGQGNNMQQMQNQHHHQNQNQHHQNQNQHHQNQNQHHQNQNQHHQNQNQHHQNQNYHNQHHQQNQQHPLMHNNQHQGEFMGGGYNRGGGWRGRGRGGPRGGRGGFAPRTNNKLKFDKDYDFEQANTEFEELRTQLAKAKIDGDKPEDAVSPVANEGVVPVVEVDKKDDSGNETGAGEPEPEDEQPSYDKSKSFFDNISCEAIERSKGRSQRTDWRTERKLNSETFGVASARRGAWRGRGGWRAYHHQPWRPMRGAGGGRGRGAPHAAPGAPRAPPVPAESK